MKRPADSHRQREQANVPPRACIWPKRLKQHLVLLRFDSSSVPEGMSASVAGPGVLQNKDPFATRIHDHRIRQQLGNLLWGPDPVASPSPRTISACRDASQHRSHLELGLEHRYIMVEFQAFGHVLLEGSHSGSPGVVMSLGAGVVERHASIRKVSHRLAFLQTVGTNVSVSHPNPGQ
eukprot:1364224-Rhodomonas_salina.1